MDHNAYQLLALGARYWFVLLAAVLVWRGAAALLHEHYQRKKLLKKLPDAGMVGEMRDIDNDRAYPLPREGVLGGGSACDIRLRGLRRRDINFAFVEGKGLLLTPCHSRGGVLLDGAPLGKPANADEAGRMLRALSGREHEVFTGVCLIDAQTGMEEAQVDRTGVRFRVLTDAEINAYVATGEPMDKAGAYGIQGGAGSFVESLDGSYENVMGFPVRLVGEMLGRFGF